MQNKLPGTIHQAFTEKPVSSTARPRARLSGFGLPARLSWSEAGSQAVTLKSKGLANWYVRVAYRLRNNTPHSKVMSLETNLTVVSHKTKGSHFILFYLNQINQLFVWFLKNVRCMCFSLCNSIGVQKIFYLKMFR